MNKDSQHSPPSPAEQAAREIAEYLLNGCGHGTYQVDHETFAAIIQQAIDRSVAETEEKYRKLAKHWRHASFCYLFDAVYDERAECTCGLSALIPKQEGEK